MNGPAEFAQANRRSAAALCPRNMSSGGQGSGSPGTWPGNFHYFSVTQGRRTFVDADRSLMAARDYCCYYNSLRI